MTYRQIKLLTPVNRRKWLTPYTSSHTCISPAQWLKLAKKYCRFIAWENLYKAKVFKPDQIDTIIEMYIRGSVSERQAMSIDRIVPFQKLSIKQLKLLVKYIQITPGLINMYSPIVRDSIVGSTTPGLLSQLMGLVGPNGISLFQVPMHLIDPNNPLNPNRHTDNDQTQPQPQQPPGHFPLSVGTPHDLLTMMAGTEDDDEPPHPPQQQNPFPPPNIHRFMAAFTRAINDRMNEGPPEPPMD
jgi:hypothetical protein